MVKAVGLFSGLSYYTTGDWRKLLRMSEVFSENAEGLEREGVQVTDPCHHSFAEPLLELRDGTQAGVQPQDVQTNDGTLEW